MMINTSTGCQIDTNFLYIYFKNLVNNFFKILPMRENQEISLPIYMRSLQIELLGCKEFIEIIKYDSLFITLLSILQYLIDNPNCPVCEVKREVFRAISICEKLKARYA